MKKIVKIFISLILAVTVFGSLNINHTKAQDQGELVVAIPQAEHGWLAGVAYYAELKAKELGIEKFRIVTSANVNEQASQLEELISQNVGAVVILPHTDELSLVAKKVVDAKIPLVVFDRKVDADYTAYVAGSNTEIGEVSAEQIGSGLEGKGKVAILNNPSSGSVSTERVDAFKKVVSEKYPDLELVEMTVNSFTKEEALRVATDTLVANPELDAIFSIDDESSLGILQAIKDANRADIKFISGAGGSQNYYKAIETEADINLFTATYSPAMIGDAIEQAWKILNGETVEKDQIVSPTVVTKENVKDLLDEKSPY